MGTLLDRLVRGFPYKPSHPPLTDATIGAWAAGTLMLVLGALGVEEEQMAHGALLAVAAGIAFAIPTAFTGLADWFQMSKGTPMRTTATIHLVVMDVATLLFVLTFILQLDGYKQDVVETSALIAGIAAFVFLVAGGYLGGTLVFVFGMRVLGRLDTPVKNALVPGREEEDDEEGEERLVSPPGAPPESPSG
jgi:uncharacterized membrane protein